MFRKLLCILACTLGLSVAGNAKADVKETLGVVNFAKVISDSKVGKQEQSSLESMRTQMSSSLSELESQIKEMSEKFKDQEYLESLNPKAEEELKMKFQKLNQEFAQNQNQFYQLLNQANMRILHTIQVEISAASEAVAKEHNLKVVINKEALFYYEANLDVTDAVIAAMDKKFEADAKAKAEKAAAVEKEEKAEKVEKVAGK